MPPRDHRATSERISFAMSVLAAAAACLFLCGSVCLFPRFNIADVGVTLFTIACFVYLITSCNRLTVTTLSIYARKQPTQSNRKRNRELIIAAILECVGGAVLIPGCLLLYSRCSKEEQTTGIILFASGCLLYGVAALLGLLSENRAANSEGSRLVCGCSTIVVVRLMFALYLLGHGAYIVGCILYLPTVNEISVAVPLFVLGSIVLIGAEIMQVSVQLHNLMMNLSEGHDK